MPPYNNIIGLDPLLIDPENGNYQPESGSPAGAYGCQIFSRSQNNQITKNKYLPKLSEFRDTIEVSGSISEDTNWNADNVMVNGDITIESNAILTISPGTNIIFTGYYQLLVEGALIAIGSPIDRIIFTAEDSSLFSHDNFPLGCWNGIFFKNENCSLPTSQLCYATIEYSKALEDENLEFSGNMGGAIRVYNRSDLIIYNNIIRNNVAHYGGAIACYKDANPIIFSNLISNNYALDNVGAIFLAYSYPRITNNTIAGNYIYNIDPYVETCGIKSFISKPILKNNIIWDNDADQPYIQQQIWEAKEYHATYNNIQDLIWENDNIDVDPNFTDYDGNAFYLNNSSPSIDAGTNDIYFLTQLDVIGNGRFWGNSIDQGCYEIVQTSTENSSIEIDNYWLNCFPNPLAFKNNQTTTTICFNLIEQANILEISIYNVKGQFVKQLDNISKTSGSKRIVWNGLDQAGKTVSSGIYFYHLNLNGISVAQNKMVVIK